MGHRGLWTTTSSLEFLEDVVHFDPKKNLVEILARHATLLQELRVVQPRLDLSFFVTGNFHVFVIVFYGQIKCETIVRGFAVLCRTKQMTARFRIANHDRQRRVFSVFHTVVITVRQSKDSLLQTATKSFVQPSDVLLLLT